MADVKEILLHMVREAMRNPINLIEAGAGWDVDESDTDVYALNKLIRKTQPIAFTVGNRKGASTSYKIIFNDDATPAKGVEYFKRGSNFIKDIIKLIIENYNLLIVDAKVAELDDYTSLMNVVDCNVMQLPDAQDVPAQDIEKKYRYRINFIVEIKDTIEVSIKTQIYNKGISLTFDADGEPIYSPEKRITADESGDVYDAEPMDLADGYAHLEALTNLSARLENVEEKKRIFELLLAKDAEIEDYIDLRMRKADELHRDINTFKFDYNIIPLTVYLDKIRDKIVTYEFSDDSGETVMQEFTVDPAADTMEFRCPHCGELCSGDDGESFVIAKGVNGENIVACTACTESIRYGVGKPLDTTYAINECVVDAISNGSGGRYHILDTFVDGLDNQSTHYHKSEEYTPDYIYLSGRISKNDRKIVTSESKVYRCDNCGKTYGIPLDMTNKFFFNHVYSADKNGKEVYCCSNCVNKTKKEVPSIKNEILVSEDTGLLFVGVGNACKCESCGKHIYSKESKRCSVCGKVVCKDCITDVGHVCAECGSVNANANKRPDKAKQRHIMSQIKPNIPLFGSKRVVFEKSKNGEIVRVFVRKRMYLFKLIDGKYVFSGKGETK